MTTNATCNIRAKRVSTSFVHRYALPWAFARKRAPRRDELSIGVFPFVLKF